MSVQISIQCEVNEEQRILLERLAVAIERNDSFAVSVIVTRLDKLGLNVQAGVENNEQSSTVIEQ